MTVPGNPASQDRPVAEYVVRMIAASPNEKVPIPDDALGVTITPIVGSSDVRVFWLERTGPTPSRDDR